MINPGGAQPVTIDTLEISVRPGTHDEDIAREVIATDCYGFRNWQPSSRRPVIVDIGAHIGSFSVMAASRYPEARILAFEANPLTADTLLLNLQKYPNVRPYIGALVGHTNLERKLHIPVHSIDDTGAYSLTPPSDATGELVHVDIPQLFKLSYILKQEGITHVDFLKIDCQGSEYEIFASLSDTVLDTIQFISGEYHYQSDINASYFDLRARLGRGFEILGMPDHPRPVGQFTAKRRAYPARSQASVDPQVAKTKRELKRLADSVAEMTSALEGSGERQNLVWLQQIISEIDDGTPE